MLHQSKTDLVVIKGKIYVDCRMGFVLMTELDYPFSSLTSGTLSLTSWIDKPYKPGQVYLSRKTMQSWCSINNLTIIKLTVRHQYVSVL